METKTEKLALGYLKDKYKYNSTEIILGRKSTPDIICSDGKRFEVKYLYGNKLIFYNTQVKSLLPEDIVLVFNNKELVTSFKWKEKQKLKNIKLVIVGENRVRIEIDEDILLTINSLKKNTQETYSDVLRRELKRKRTIKE